MTPSRTQRVNMPVREEPPLLSEFDDEPDPSAQAASATEAAAPDVDLASAEDLADVEPDQELAEPHTDPQMDVEPPPPPEDEMAAPVYSESPPTRIPSPQPILTRQRQSMTYGIASDIGIVRDNNEDACFGMQWHSITVDNRPDFGLFIVADGMGGHLDGERASGVAVQTLAAEMLDSIYVPMLKDFKAGSSPTILEALVNASERANQAVMKRVPGGGTTLSAVAIVGNLAYLAHVGDSRAYLVHGDQIEQLTTDHTLVQRLVEMKELTLEEAEYYPQKNVLYRAIGQNEKLKMERLIRTLPPGAQVLLCTDGLWDLVEPDTIREVAVAAGSPQEACDRLVSIANDRGGSDNITVIVLKVPSDEAST
ncbi:MAG: protein phosphatase 2C domain-containing protein [Chloroflexi bacterium]|nr:protein phosphatase 2C domain-containing protein [Chloroflexota bacterium]